MATMAHHFGQLLALTALTALSAGLDAQPPHVAWADFGRAWLQELGEAEPPALDAMLQRHYARLPLADFDVRVPNTLLGKSGDPAEVAAIADALLRLQDRIDELTVPDAAALSARHQEVAELRKWLAAWRKKPDTEPPTATRRESPCILVLAPERRDFVALVGWLGLLKQQYRDYWWNDGTAQFVDLRVQDEGQVQIVALEYAAPDQQGDATRGFAMSTRERTGLLQHVLQRAGLSWCWRWLGDDADRSFVLGLATSLVTDVLGQNNARSGGSDSAKTTEGRNAFIPGAPSRGGSMEMVNADSKWRLSQGQDWFARPLRQAQKAGVHAAKKSRDKLGHFLLDAKQGEAKHLVTAPFLGGVAYDRDEVPSEFLDDYLEFHRAYRAAFVHWLEQQGGRNKDASLAAFRALMAKLLAVPPKPTFEEACSDVYGVPLSSKDAEQDTLERRFLEWLTKNAGR